MAALTVNEGHVLSRGGFRARDVNVVTLPGGPVQAYDVELTALRALPPTAEGRARVLVRVHGVPITLVRLDVPPEGLAPAQLAARLEEVLGPASSPIPRTSTACPAQRVLAENGPHLTVQIATQGPARAAAALPRLARGGSLPLLRRPGRRQRAAATATPAPSCAAWELAHPSIPVRYLQRARARRGAGAQPRARGRRGLVGGAHRRRRGRRPGVARRDRRGGHVGARTSSASPG